MSHSIYDMLNELTRLQYEIKKEVCYFIITLYISLTASLRRIYLNRKMSINSKRDSKHNETHCKIFDSYFTWLNTFPRINCWEKVELYFMIVSPYYLSIRANWNSGRLSIYLYRFKVSSFFLANAEWDQLMIEHQIHCLNIRL